METIANPNEWAQFGLAGLVIAALFAMVSYLSKTMLNHFNAVVLKHEETIGSFRSEHAQERLEWRKEHLDERRTWQETSTKQGDDLKLVVGTLTDAVRELKMKNNSDNVA